MTRGMELMFYGMGTVVLFLALLVLATRAMSRCIARFLPEPEPRAAVAEVEAMPVHDPRLVAVISAALARHRARRS